MAGVVKIDFKIGGADAVARAISTVLKSSERAIRQSTQNEQKANRERVSGAAGASRSVIAEQRKVAAEQRRMEREAVAVVRQANREKVQEERRASAEVVAVVRQANREKMAEERKLENEKRRAENQAKNRAEQNAKERNRLLGGMVGGGVSGAAHGVATLGRGAGALVRGGMDLAGSLMSGAGVEFGLSRSIQVRAELEKRAVDLSNSGYQENGKGIQTQRVDPRTLMKEASAVGMASAIDPSQAIEGVAGFTKVTGDLATARALLPDISKFARATGTDLAQAVAAAGEMGKAMGDAATNEEEARQKAAAIMQVMKGVAGQGKLGSIEMSDWAKGGARYAAAAQQFEGNAGSNMLKVGMLGQEARGGGGAWNPATAAAAVSGLVTTFTTPSRKKAFDSMGISLKGEGGKLRDPVAIISEAIDKTGGDINKLQPMFANVVGARAMRGLSNKYLEGSGGGTDEASKGKGRAKLQEEIDRMTKGAVMSDKDINDSNAASMNSLEAKAQIFQQRLDQIAGDMADKLIPAMLKFAPVAEQGAAILTKFIEAVAPNADQLAKALGQLAPAAAQAATMLAKLIGGAVESPKAAAALLVGGMAAKGALGVAAGSSLVQGAIGSGVGALAGSAKAAGAGLLAKGGGALAAGGTVAAVVGAAVAGGMLGTMVTDSQDQQYKDRTKTRQALGNESTVLQQKMFQGTASESDIKRARELTGQLRATANDGSFSGKVDKMLGDDSAARAGEQAAALEAALSKAIPKQDPAAMGAAMAGPIAEAVGAAVGAANAQNPKIQPPG
jgi:hypothetical protein